ncbi:MAG: PKD-like domain-containing protein, partial [Crocinitomicaceae bacterium]
MSFSQSFPNLKDLSTGQGAVGSLDPVWTVSNLIPLNTIPTNPDIYTYTPALINNNCAPGSWVSASSLPAPINNGNWIIAAGENCLTNGTPGGFRFFRLKLTLPALCDGKSVPQNYVLYLTGYVDDIIQNVYLNGVSKNINGGSYTNAGKINFELKDSWKAGDNYIDVLVKNNPPSSSSGPNPYGLLLVADPVKSATTDLDQDGIPDLTDACPCQKWSEGINCVPACSPSGITISTHPSDQSTCAGNNVNFTVNSTGSKFQWKESRDNGVTFSPITNGGVYSGAQTATLTITGITNNYNGYLYKCILLNTTATCKDSTNSASVTLTPLNTTTKVDIEVCEGKTVDLLSTSTFSTSSNYTWAVPNGITNPGNVHKVTANTPGIYTVNVFTPTNTNLICNGDFEQPITSSSVSNITNFPCWKNTAEANIEVWKSGYQGVSSQSGNQFIELNANTPGTLYSDLTNLTQGASIDISFAHRGRSGTDVMKVLIGPPLPALESTCTVLGTYSTGNAAWKTYSGSYTVPTNGNYSLRFISVSSTGGASLGNFIDNVIVKYTASLCANISKEFTVKTIPLPTATISGEASVCKDDVASPTLTFTGSNGTSPYIFTYSINNGANQTIASTGNTAVLTIPTSSIGTFDYKLISVKEGSTQTCEQNQTGTKSFKVIPVSVGGTLSSNQTICSGNTPNNLTLTGNVGTITKWQSSEVPYDTWTDINNTTTTYSPTALTKSTKFRVEVKNEVCDPVYSNEITITVDASTVGGSVSSDQSICETVTPNALTLSGHTGQISKWQFSTTPFNTWSDITNVTSSNTLTKLTQTTKYRAVLKSGVCPEAFSQPATITIKSLEKLNVSCGASTMTEVEFTWSDVSDETSYDYSYIIAGGTPSTGSVSTNVTSVSIPVTTEGQSVQITLTPTNATCAEPEIQNCISITCPTPITNQISDISICSGQNITIPAFISPNTTTAFTWKVNYPSFSIGENGSNDIPTFTAPTTNTKITATFSVNAKNAVCIGPTMNFKLVINPPPTLNVTNDGPICIGTRPIQLNENSGNGITWNWSTNGSGSFSSTTIQNPTINNPANGEIITVTAKDANNCTNTATTTLIVNPLPIINAGTDQTSCSGNSITLNASGGLSYNWDKNVVNGVTFIPNATTTYTVTGTDANGCKNTDQVIVNVTQTPKINDVSENLCSGNSFTTNPLDNINGQVVPIGTNYTWTVSTTANVSGASNEINAQNSISSVLTNNSISTETVTYTVTAHNGVCNSNFKINAKVFPLPEFTPSARSKCVNDPLYVKANLTNVSSLTWTGPNNFTKNQSNDDEVLVSNNAQTNLHQGSYNVTATDLNNCSYTKNIVININALPDIDAGLDKNVCENEAIILKGTGGVNYTWNNSVSDGVSFVLNSTKTFIVTGIDANGCSNTDQVTVNVNLLPTIDAGIDKSICIGDNITLKANGGVNYTWDNNVVDNVSFSPTTLTTYTVVGTDANNCQNSDQITINVNPLPVFTPTATSQCENDPLFLQANFPTATKVVWSNTNGFSNTATSDSKLQAFVSAKSTDNGTYSVEVTDANGCKKIESVNVTINPLPTISAGLDKEICIGNTIKLIGSGAVSYSWDNGISDNINFSPTLTKTYTVTGTDALGCKNTDDVIVSVNPLPDFNLSINEPCEQSNLVFSVDLTNNPSTAGIYSSSWNGSNGFASTVLNPSISNVTSAATGVYNFELIDNNKCSKSKSINALIHLVDNIQFADLNPKCINDDPFLLPVPNIIGGTWSSDDNSSIQNPYSGLFDPKKSKPDQEYKVVVTYSTKSILPARKCPSTLSKVIFVNPIPDSTFYAKNPVICIDDTLHLVINQPNKNVNYTWDLGNGNIIKLNNQQLDYIYPKDGDFTIKLLA